MVCNGMQFTVVIVGTALRIRAVVLLLIAPGFLRGQSPRPHDFRARASLEKFAVFLVISMEFFKGTMDGT